MLLALVCAQLVVAAPLHDFEGVWQGTLQTEFWEARHKQRRVQQSGHPHRLTMTISRKGNRIQGEWSEDGRRLAFEGRIDHNKFFARPTRVLEGKWNANILNDLQFSGELHKGVLAGWLHGAGKNQERTGEFELRRKASSSVVPDK